MDISNMISFINLTTIRHRLKPVPTPTPAQLERLTTVLIVVLITILTFFLGLVMLLNLI